MQQQHRDPRVGLVLVGFSPPRPFAAIARHLGWHGAVLSDADRALYDALGIGRAPWWRTYSPGTLLTYGRARLSGRRWSTPVEDPRQLGADAVMVDGRVTDLWRPRTPNDRPAAGCVLAVASSRADRPPAED